MKNRLIYLFISSDRRRFCSRSLMKLYLAKEQQESNSSVRSTFALSKASSAVFEELVGPSSCVFFWKTPPYWCFINRNRIPQRPKGLTHYARNRRIIDRLHYTGTGWEKKGKRDMFQFKRYTSFYVKINKRNNRSFRSF